MDIVLLVLILITWFIWYLYKNLKNFRFNESVRTMFSAREWLEKQYNKPYVLPDGRLANKLNYDEMLMDMLDPKEKNPKIRPHERIDYYNDRPNYDKFLWDMEIEDFKFIFGDTYENFFHDIIDFNKPVSENPNGWFLPFNNRDLVFAHQGKLIYEGIRYGYNVFVERDNPLTGLYKMRYAQRLEYLMRKAHPEDCKNLTLYFLPEFEGDPENGVFKIEKGWIKGKFMWKYTWDGKQKAIRAWSEDGESTLIKYLLSLTDAPRDENGNFKDLWF